MNFLKYSFLIRNSSFFFVYKLQICFYDFKELLQELDTDGWNSCYYKLNQKIPITLFLKLFFNIMYFLNINLMSSN